VAGAHVQASVRRDEAHRVDMPAAQLRTEAPGAGATVVAKALRSPPFVGVPSRHHSPLTCGYVLRRTLRNPIHPPWQCDGPLAPDAGSSGS
jgi:hypothetical protein